MRPAAAPYGGQCHRGVTTASQPALHPIRFLPGEQHLCRRARAHRQLSADWDAVAKSGHPLRGRYTNPVVTLAPEHLSRFAGDVPQPREDRPGRGQQPVLPGRRRQLAQPRTENESALKVTRDEAMMLQCHRKPVSRWSGQTGRRDQSSEGGWSGLQGAQHEGGFVKDADTARVVHALILPSRMLECKSGGGL